MSFVFRFSADQAGIWRARFAREMPDLPFHVWPETGEARDVRYLAAWQMPGDLAQMFPGLEILFSIGAGVDQLDLGAVPPGLRIVRMVEPALVEGMVEYVQAAVLGFHRDLFHYARQQAAGIWDPISNRPASSYSAGVMGLGALGTPVLRALMSMGYVGRGWSRTPRAVEGATCFAGDAELDAFLAGTDILICLVPLTDSTRGILNAGLFGRLPQGACVINVGRGGHLVQEDLLAALESGHLAQAVLDVTTPEPLPADHPLWRHPRVFLTPHIASKSQAETGAEAVIANLRRYQRGEAMIGEVDTGRGY